MAAPVRRVCPFVEALAWLRYMELPYLGRSVLVRWGRPPGLHDFMDPRVAEKVTIRGPRGEQPGVLVASEEAMSMHGLAIPVPEMGPGLYSVGLSLDRGVYTHAETPIGRGGRHRVCVYGGKREAEEAGLNPLESLLVRGYATTYLLLGYEEKVVVEAPSPFGYELEIVPMDVRNIVEPETVLEVQVLYKGEPLPNTRLEVIYTTGETAATETSDAGVAVVKTGPLATIITVEVMDEAEVGAEYDRVKHTATLTIQALTI